MSHGGLRDIDPWDVPDAGEEARASRWPFDLSAVAEVLEVVALALFMFIAVRAVAQNFIVDGGSMEPNLSDGQLVIVNKLAYRSYDFSWLPGVDNGDWRPFGDPQPGDIVVFRFPQSPDRDFIKRVIAVPGQVVEVLNDAVFVDGVRLDEPYIDEAPGYRFGPVPVPPGQLFVLGDNRNNSYDSHSWGMLDQDLVIGRADVRYWPLSAAGTLSHSSPRSPSEEVSASP